VKDRIVGSESERERGGSVAFVFRNKSMDVLPVTLYMMFWGKESLHGSIFRLRSLPCIDCSIVRLFDGRME